MTTTVVKTIGATGADYTTLQAWEDATPASLTAVDQIWQGQIKASTDVFTAGVLISGTTVDSTRYAELTTAAGASFRDNASVQSNALRYNSSNGCAINFSTAYAVAVQVSQNYTRISNLQIQATNANGTALSISAATGTDVNNCILEGIRANGFFTLNTCGPIRNSLIVQRASGATHIGLLTAANAYNCTFAVPSDKTAATYGVDGRYGTQTLSNCAVFGVGTVVRGGTNTFTTCYTNVASPPSGCTTLTYNTSAFVNITDATRDYRIPSGSGLIDVGTTDSTNAATDIAGTSRPSGSSYDVGCWEYVAASASVFIPIIGRGPGLALAAGRGLAG